MCDNTSSMAHAKKVTSIPSIDSQQYNVSSVVNSLKNSPNSNDN